MRRVWVGFGFVLVAAVGVGLSTTRTVGQPAAGGAADAQHKKVTVTGVGTVAVKPDTARLSFAVRASGTDFKSAVAECDKKAAAIEKAIAELKLGGLEVKKGPVQLTSMNNGPGFPMPGFPPGGRGGLVPMPLLPPGGEVPPRPGAGADQPGGLVVKAVAAQQPPAAAGGQPPARADQPPFVAPDQPLGLPGQPFPGPGQPFPGMGGGVEVVRSYTVVASFGTPNSAGELGDIVKITDKIQTTVVGAGGTESPMFLPANQQYGYGGGFGPNGHGDKSAVLKIEFHRANLAAARQEALKAAVADAVANAKAAAGVANITAKDIVGITDQNQFGGPFGGGGMANATGRGEVLGEMEMTVQVSVTFSY